ncbi:hypothetical protein Anapl_00106 [Anas platyrhynchos]|uniref:Uncharacterized protein n=1 Tax=Anas platyrhynchos TaxID=8839 RepID=R0K2K3_ANAPL|nr:hypothetical protein Anapl_00106 [Anas platyrhynchos]
MKDFLAAGKVTSQVQGPREGFSVRAQATAPSLLHPVAFPVGKERFGQHAAALSIRKPVASPCLTRRHFIIQQPKCDAEQRCQISQAARCEIPAGSVPAAGRQMLPEPREPSERRGRHYRSVECWMWHPLSLLTTVYCLKVSVKKKSVAILDFRLKFPKCVSELIRQNVISRCNGSGIQFADLTVLGHISQSGDPDSYQVLPYRHGKSPGELFVESFGVEPEKDEGPSESTDIQ